MYVSFKYGEFEGMRNGRYFTDMTEKSLDSLIGSINESAKCGIACIKRSWMTRDVRKERDEKRQKLKDDYGVTESTTVYELNL